MARKSFWPNPAVGMTNAAMTTQELISRFHPRGLVFSGIAGAIDSSVHIGDLVYLLKLDNP